MEATPRMAVAVAGALLAGLTFVWLANLPLTGLSVLEGNPGALAFIEPTPNNGSTTNAPWIAVNITSPAPLTLAFLTFGSNNVTMTINGSLAWATVNGSGSLSMQAFAISENGTALAGEQRWIRISYLNWSPIAEHITNEDTPFNLLLGTYLSSAKNLSLIKITTAQDRSDRLSCALSGHSMLQCQPLPDTKGSTTITIVADDETVTSTITFNATILPVNDPPRLSTPIPSKTISSNGHWDLDLTTHFNDQEGDPLTFTTNETVSAPIVWTSIGALRIKPNSTTIGTYTFSIIANDSFNTTFSNTITLRVNQNLAPLIITKLKSLTLNNSKAYRLRLYQVFQDPEDDPLTFEYQSPPILRVVKEGDSVYLITLPNISGQGDVRLLASDGELHTAFTLPVTVLQGANTAIPGATPTPSNTHPPATPSIPDQTIPPDRTTTIHLAPHMNLSSFDEEESRVTITGSQHLLIDSIVGFNLTLKAPTTWTGTETLQARVADHAHSILSNPFTVTVTPSPTPSSDPGLPPVNLTTPTPTYTWPTQKKPLPPMTLGKNQSIITLDLRDFFEDPSGQGLDFAIESKKGIKAAIHSKNLAVIGLAAPSPTVQNGTLRIIARDAQGNMVTGDLAYEVLDEVIEHQTGIDSLLRLAMATLLLFLVGVAYYRHSSQPIQTGTPHVRPFIPSIYAGWNELGSSMISLIRPSPNLDEPLEFKREALIIKEVLYGLNAIVSSCDDRLVKAAIRKEQEKLQKALNLLKGKAQLSRYDMKRLTLYIKEVAASMEQILDLTEEYLIYHELRRPSLRLKGLARDLEVKLSYLGEFPRFKEKQNV